ncbi:MAG: class I SAM-dependent methyltransferase [Candidatus Lokiarchaeia archaeon]
MKKVKVVKFLMNVLPNKPKYQENHFIQEIFRHPKYISLTQNEKKLFFERLVRLNIIEAKRKPFDLFFPSHSFRKMMEGKRVLDLGCSIGGDTISMGENWNVKEFYGIDANQESILVANHFISKHLTNVKFQFIHCYAEKIPFENDFFDAIVSKNTIEHVRSVKKTLSECKRILKKDGNAFLVFPSFKFPFGGAHINSVTRMPFLEWFFSPNTVNEAYQEIVSEWGEDLNWYNPTEETKGDWAVVKCGIGVNGTNYKDFITIAEEIGFSNISFVKIPLLYVSNTAIKYPIVKFFASFLKPLLSIDYFKDYLTHRFVFVLKK